VLDNDKKQFAQIVRSTMLVCGGSAPEPDVLSIWWASFQNYAIGEVSAAFSEYVMIGAYAPKPADIVGILKRLVPDGRPGADEAWAMIPRDEHTSAVMSQEMAEALHYAQPLLDEGDQVGARMTFKEAYVRIVDTNTRNGVKPIWSPSLGHDKDGRDSVLAEAVRLGRITAEHAISLVAPDKIYPMLQSAGQERLAVKYKMPTSEAALENLARIKLMLARKSK